MRLVDNWRAVLKHAWSLRFIVAAGAFSAAEVILPYFQERVPEGLFASLSGACAMASFIARMTAQKKLNDGQY